MKSIKLNIIKAVYLILAILSLTQFGCNENSNIINLSHESGAFSDNSGVIVEAQYTPGNPGFYSFWIRNNMTDTIINDFHVQVDSSLIITSHRPRTGWVTDSPTSDTAKGRVGVRCNEHGCEFRPGEHGYPLSNVKLASTKLSVNMTFTWQATRNGTVVAQGTGTLP